MDDFNLDSVDFESAEAAVQERMENLDKEVAIEADNDCGDGGCVI